MSAREQLIAALERQDQDALRALGWNRVFLTWTRGWRRRHDPGEYLVLARFAGDHDPEDVLAAIDRLAIDPDLKGNRPGAGQIAHALGTARERRQPRDHDVDVVLRVVRERLESGARACTCPARLPHVRLENGAVVCVDCGGVDPGQVDAALEMAA